jgi:hypothetical protein
MGAEVPKTDRLPSAREKPKPGDLSVSGLRRNDDLTAGDPCQAVAWPCLLN